MRTICAGATLALVSMSAHASLITFNAVGSPDVSGFVQFDDSAFSGAAVDDISNTNITDLSLTVLGHVFGFADVVATDETRMDTSGVPAIITNGIGALAFNGDETIAFFPDGFGGTATDGDASLALDTDGDFTFGGSGWENFFAVRWEVEAVPAPATLALLGIGLVALGFRHRR